LKHFKTNLAVAVGMAMATMAPATAGANTGTDMVSYYTAGTYEQTTNTDGGLTAAASGTGDCRAACAAAPAAGAFTISLTVTKAHPPSPCRFLQATGTLQATWSDSTSSAASISAHWLDHQAIRINGTVTSGTYQGRSISALFHPPSPCSGPFTGTLSFSG